jgi:purine-nucleoside phosphorylase
MGQPSMAIYVNELYKFYNVDTIIRIGTCGAFIENINIGDIILPMSSCSESNITTTKFYNDFTFAPTCDYGLLEKAVNSARKNELKYHVGSIVSIDHFYRDDQDWWKTMRNHSILGVDMETHVLYYLAMKYKKKSLTINFVSDNLVTKDEINSIDRTNKISNVMRLITDII